MPSFDWPSLIRAPRTTTRTPFGCSSNSFVTFLTTRNAAYLSLGDLAISEVKQDEQPTYEQISKARESYKLVWEKTEDMRLVTDATFNEGGLLERVPTTQRVG